MGKCVWIALPFLLSLKAKLITVDLDQQVLLQKNLHPDRNLALSRWSCMYKLATEHFVYKSSFSDRYMAV